MLAKLIKSKRRLSARVAPYEDPTPSSVSEKGSGSGSGSGSGGAGGSSGGRTVAVATGASHKGIVGKVAPASTVAGNGAMFLRGMTRLDSDDTGGGDASVPALQLVDCDEDAAEDPFSSPKSVAAFGDSGDTGDATTSTPSADAVVSAKPQASETVSQAVPPTSAAVTTARIIPRRSRRSSEGAGLNVDFKTLRLVVVDDESANTRVMCRHLSKLGVPSANITSFTDGAQLVTYLKSFPSPPPSCILLDLLMPILGGLEAVTTLKEEGIPLPCPVLAATGNVTSGTSAQCRALGFSGMLGKPFTRGRLKRTIQMVLDPANDASFTLT